MGPVIGLQFLHLSFPEETTIEINPSLLSRNQCKSGLFKVNLSGKVDAVMYKSRLYTKMSFLPSSSAQVFRV